MKMGQTQTVKSTDWQKSDKHYFSYGFLGTPELGTIRQILSCINRFFNIKNLKICHLKLRFSKFRASKNFKSYEYPNSWNEFQRTEGIGSSNIVANQEIHGVQLRRVAWKAGETTRRGLGANGDFLK